MQVRTSAFEKSIKTSELISKTYLSCTVLLAPPNFAKRLPEERVLRTTCDQITAENVLIVYAPYRRDFATGEE